MKKVQAIRGMIHDVSVVDESEHYYITPCGELLSKQHYEPAPTERWVDVTGECTFDESGDLCFRGEACLFNTRRGSRYIKENVNGKTYLRFERKESL